MKDKKLPKVAVLTSPLNDVAGETILANWIDILNPIAEKIFVITGKFNPGNNRKVEIVGRQYFVPAEKSIFHKAIGLLRNQFAASFALLKIARNVDIFSFHMGMKADVLPMLCCKLRRKKVVFSFFGSGPMVIKRAYGYENYGVLGAALSFFWSFLQKLNCLMADQIAVESPAVVDFARLASYRSKIRFHGALYIDTRSFSVRKDLTDRRLVVGYIGRFVPEKGAVNLARAIPLILKERNDIEFLMGGGGPELSVAKRALEEAGISNRVSFTGWLAYEDVPRYLNELRLLVLPSYVEGIPGIVQEAMACGTPVLATPVGGIPDLIKDGGPGFIMENNSPECIAKNVLRVLENPHLTEIARKARKLIEDNYGYETMVAKTRTAFQELLRHRNKVAE